ncbi:MAG TPA: amino acid ABC transporter substrate-binding protein [Stellaceae bacterium]|nr:amino acid ABC transporter substrate-binding protein [Stellaceae bacterium]
MRRSAFALVLALALAAPSARAAEPVKLGFSMSLTGALANTGRVALAAIKLWEADINSKGGILGRPVQLVYYDDQSTSANVPTIYTKLLDVDKVDLVVGPYSTAQTAPAMPTVMEHGKVFIGLSAIAINSHFHYPRYFSMTNAGPDPNAIFSKGFIAAAMRQNPKPQTIAFSGADIEFSQSVLTAAREIAKAAGLKTVYDKSYPPTTTDYAPIVRAVQAANPDLFYLASYPPDSVGIVRAINEIGFRPKMVGGATVGLNNVSIKMQLGPLLNGIVGYENWLPTTTLSFPGVQPVLERYQETAKTDGLDPLGWSMVPAAYAETQVLGAAVNAVGSLDQDKIAQYMHSHAIPTIWGDIAFGPEGEWTEGRMIVVQYRNITGKTLDQFTNPANEPIIDPPKYQTGELIYPYADALK